MTLGLQVLILAVAMGAAGQNIIFGLFCLIAMGFLDWRKIRSLEDVGGMAPILSYRSRYFAFWLWVVMSGWLFHGQSLGASFKGMVGWLAPLLLPSMVYFHIKQKNNISFGKLQNFMFLFFAILGLVALSQWVWGWQYFRGMLHFREFRAYGFHSHPLTFAYCMLLFAPILWAKAVHSKKPRELAGFLGVLMTIMASLSRTVQAVFVFQWLWDVMRNRSVKVRKLLFLSFVAFLLMISLSDNPIRQKVLRTVQGTEDVHSSYPDDRVAFWHAHWQLIKRKPWVGHGVAMSKDVLQSAYEEIGLGDFTKQYAAHNTFIQVWAESGVVGLLLYLGFIWQLLASVWRMSLVRPDFRKYVYAFVGFWVASLTQNAFQDSEVRGAFCVLICVMIAELSQQQDVAERVV